MHSNPTIRLIAAAALISTLASASFAQAVADQPTTATPPTPTPTPTPTPLVRAADGPSLVHQAFQRADANKDGKLSPDEATLLPAVAAKFSQLDTDKDGFISEAEFTIGVRIGN